MIERKHVTSKWGILWRSECSLDGKVEYLMFNLREFPVSPILFVTRREAREYVEKKYGYIKNRPDLRKEPHGWKMPKVVKVKCTYEI